jgi:short subunit dehydrogenase-like uncharacterized protein
MSEDFLIYGANGYTGTLIARLAVAQGLRPILAGRNPQSLQALAQELEVEYRAFSLDDLTALAQNLAGVTVVLNTAGPFKRTSLPLAKACLDNKVHYLDIAGEVPEFIILAELDEQAQKKEVMLMPGVGFGVVPTDSLAAFLKKQLPSATSLTLAYQTIGGVSRGTLTTVLSDLHKPGVVRQNKQLIKRRAASTSRKLDLGNGLTTAVLNPWRGDIFTALYTTGIPNIETYSVFPPPLVWLMKSSRLTGRLLASGPVQNFLKKQSKKQPAGPSEAERAAGKSLVWGEVSDPQGHKVSARLSGPEAYDFTARTAFLIVQKVLDGNALAGFQTPAGVYGPDLVLEIEGVNRQIITTTLSSKSDATLPGATRL